MLVGVLALHGQSVHMVYARDVLLRRWPEEGLYRAVGVGILTIPNPLSSGLGFDVMGDNLISYFIFILQMVC